MSETAESETTEASSNAKTVEERVIEIFNKTLSQVPEDGVTSETTLEDLNVDSFDVIEVTFMLEEEFDVDLREEDAEGIESVGDFAKRFQELLDRQKS